MRFHQYVLTKSLSRNREDAKKTLVEYYTDVGNGNKRGLHSDLYAAGWCEGRWLSHNRPFYNVYPAVVDCLRNTSLDLSIDQVTTGGDSLAICFADGKEVVSDDDLGTRAMILGTHKLPPSDTGGTVCMSIATWSFASDGGPMHGIWSVRPDDGEMISDSVAWHEISPGFRDLLSIAIGVLLLRSDERFTEPILLRKDRGKKFASKEDYDRAVARAKRRGSNGMTIGAGMENSPHVRRPHFGLRWTGPGSKIAKLVPIKGCVVKRDKLYPIPTGNVGAVGVSET